jgi:hypothetical protein
MLNKEIEKYEIVQINPTKARNKMFAGCLLTVVEVKSWGVQGYVQALGVNGNPGLPAYYRAVWEEIEKTDGKSVFIIPSSKDEEEE